MRGQDDEAALGEVLLSRGALLAAASSGDADLAYVAKVLSPNADDQNVPMVQALFCDKKLRAWLSKEGHHRDAAVLEALGDAHAAWDMSGLTAEWRDGALQRLSNMLVQAFGRRLTHVSGAASSRPVGGMPRDLLMALAGNGDVRRQLLLLFPWLSSCLSGRAARMT